MKPPTDEREPLPASAVSAVRLRFGYDEGSFLLPIDELEIAPREHVAIVGPSGSGKTTLLHLIAGILEAESGELQVLGERLQGRSAAFRRRFRLARIGLIFQEFELLEHLTVRENILLPYYIARHLRVDRAVEERMRALAERAGISDYLARKPRRLSQGERQRVAVCRALVTGPDLVLADEPTGNLDPRRSRQVIDEIQAQVRAHDAALVTVTHDPSLLDRFDRVVDLGTLHEESGGSTR